MADEVVQTPFGKFLVDMQDCVGSTLKAGTLWDGPGFLQVIAKEYGQLGQDGAGTILDIGANIGSFSVWLAHRGAQRVIAVEPMPETLRYLRANLDLNQGICADTVVLVPVAAYDKFCKMSSPDYSSTNQSGACVVPQLRGPIQAEPLDVYRWLFHPGVCLIKIDAQGCDGAVLRGLAQTIETDHPAIVFEWEEHLAGIHGYTLADTIEWLTFRGYDIHEWPSHPHNFLARPR